MMAANFGPLPVDEGIARCRRFHDEALDDPFIRGNALVELGALEAMRGNFPLARELLGEGLDTIAELGFALRAAMSMQEAFYVEMLAGDLDSRRADRARGLRDARAHGRARLPLVGSRPARTRALARGELDEAERFSRTSEEATAPDDTFSHVLWRTARAKIRARSAASFVQAEALAREAVAIAERTDLLNTHGDTLGDLAEVIALAGRRHEAADVYRQAAEIFERKGNLASLGRVRLAAEGLDR